MHKSNQLSTFDLSLVNGPIAMNPRNFTSLSRTPWAGTALARGIKRSHAQSPMQLIGESWEVSCDPEAPSQICGQNSLTLSALIAHSPSKMLSEGLVSAGRDSCEILVKLLNAASPLSLQIHPSDSHPGLKLNECGKPESWLVLDAVPGAGLFLGFSRLMALEDIESAIKNETFAADALYFVPVRKGDYFEIAPGVPHAIGPGVVLLEPQRIMPGKSGKTWRMWDWNRKYNAHGEIDMPGGSPRELHIDQSMTLLRPDQQIGESYVKTLRREAKRYRPGDGVEVSVYPSNPYYQVIYVKMEPDTKLRLRQNMGFAAMTVIEGFLQSLSRHQGEVKMNIGESFFVPAHALPLELTAGPKRAEFSLVIPAGQGVDQHDGMVFE